VIQAPPGTAVVTKQVDGDTVRVTINGEDESVRFIGIDTPETHGRNGLIECFGAEAAGHTAALIPVGTTVRLVRDAEARDRYGRLLAYVYRTKDNLFVNLALARDGYADVLTYPPNVAHAAEFVAAVADARDAERGLWQKCGSADVPVDP
jgi:micrococcal nuclease